MKTYRISSKVSGKVLGTTKVSAFEGANEQEALDTFARNAGHHDFANMRESSIFKGPQFDSLWDLQVTEMAAQA